MINFQDRVNRNRSLVSTRQRLNDVWRIEWPIELIYISAPCMFQPISLPIIQYTVHIWFTTMPLRTHLSATRNPNFLLFHTHLDLFLPFSSSPSLSRVPSSAAGGCPGVRPLSAPLISGHRAPAISLSCRPSPPQPRRHRPACAVSHPLPQKALELYWNCEKASPVG
jgi:hypothetical protein